MGQGTPHSPGVLKDQGGSLDPICYPQAHHAHARLAQLTSKLIIYNVGEDSFKIRKQNAGPMETMCLSLSGGGKSGQREIARNMFTCFPETSPSPYFQNEFNM